VIVVLSPAVIVAAALVNDVMVAGGDQFLRFRVNGGGINAR
jgi:hypothetical protein